MLQEGENRLQLDRVLKIANPIHLEELVNCAGQPFVSKWHSNLVTFGDDQILLGSSTWVSNAHDAWLVAPRWIRIIKQ